MLSYQGIADWHGTAHGVSKKSIMKKVSFLIGVATMIASAAFAQKQQTFTYKPKSPELERTITGLDSTFFNASYTCDFAKIDAMLADSMEFYHENGGLLTSKKILLGALKDNVCGKVKRIMVKGSLEVYPIGDDSAAEFGLHQFLSEETDEPSKPNRFMIIWRQKNGKWQITRIVDLN
jgi:hypothetical protein